MTNVTQGFISIGGGQSVSGDSAPPPPPDLGAANFRKDMTIGIAQNTILAMVTPTVQGVGIAHQQFLNLLSQQGVGVTHTSFASGTVKPVQGVGVNHTSILSMQTPPAITSGVRLIQTWDYTGTKYAINCSSQGTSSVSNPSNANGAPNGTLANMVGDTLQTRSYELRTNGWDTIGLKDSLTIDKVEVRFWARQTGTVLNNGNMSFRRSFAPGHIPTTLANYTGNVNFLSSPDVHDVTSIIAGDWDNVRNLRLHVNATMPIGGALINVDVDAFELHIEASLIE